jgi:hypothetical protein
MIHPNPATAMKAPMQTVNILNLERISAEDRARIEAIDPAVNLTIAEGWFDGEYRETWPAYSSARFLRPGATGSGTREEGDRLLADAEVVLGGWPFPLDLRARRQTSNGFISGPRAPAICCGAIFGAAT